MTRLIADVTPADIEIAREYRAVHGVSATHCPIALAAQRALGNDRVAVSGYGIGRQLSEVEYTMTAVARDYMRRFDAGLPVMPRRFVFPAMKVKA